MEDKSKLEKMGYKPDGSLKKNKTGIIIVLAIVLVPLLIGFIALSQSNSGWMDEDAGNESIYGTWQYYGVIPYDSDYQANLDEKDIITGNRYKDEFGQNVPDQTITITENGIKEYLDMNGKGSEVTGWGKDEQTDNQWFMTIKITQFAGEKPLNEPVTEKYMLTLRDKYLIMECYNDSDEYDDSEYANVYTKVN